MSTLRALGVSVVVLCIGCIVPRAPESRALQPSPWDDHAAMMSPTDLAAPVVHPVHTADGRPAQGHESLPASAATARARLAASPRHAEWVKIPWGAGASDSLMAWVVYPITDRTHAPVVVVVHEIFGLSTWARAVADQAAAEGFIAIAPDLVSRARGGPSTDELPGDSAG
jgi:carboxymethylenebutenolidase